MSHSSLTIIREEHAALAAMLRSLLLMVERGPKHDTDTFFSVLRAMLFYVDEFPERLHHTKETDLFFPKLRGGSAEVDAAIDRLDREHAKGEAAIRELQHLLVAWEMIGDTRRGAFEGACIRYVNFYLDHMRTEEMVVLPSAEKRLSEADWAELDEAFATNRDPLTGKYPADPAYERLFAQILLKAPAPIGVGEDI
jgi:hemerythrin-like domain-containing protein